MTNEDTTNETKTRGNAYPLVFPFPFCPTIRGRSQRTYKYLTRLSRYGDGMTPKEEADMEKAYQHLQQAIDWTTDVLGEDNEIIETIFYAQSLITDAVSKGRRK